jgi:hypothetical protein
MCHQLIMGAGKTTVVAPLLALMLASSSILFLSVVPPSLLAFAQVSVLVCVIKCFKRIRRTHTVDIPRALFHTHTEAGVHVHI